MTRHRRLLLLVIPLSLFGVRCNSAECEAKRDELWTLRDSWTRCEEDWECVKVLGNPGDCSGILSCDFSANRTSRLEAERRIAEVAEETTDCLQCATPNCVSGVVTLCEPVSQRCILVTGVAGAAADTAESRTRGTGGAGRTSGTGGTSGAGGTAGSGAAAGSR
jgi:hypothetical protein